ncbi:condensation domain-containing protein [Streptomyces sp. enrichment culture]|uniref:condensation domain-containing protein n=1 Tax=Streptomyces sp. enrichment culture TaxID=1795815 RepID=UPI003F55D7DC
MSGSPAGFPSRLPLTAGQAGIWYGRQLDPSGLAHAYAEFLDITGPLDPGLLRDAVRRTFAEAEALSTSFGEDADGPWQRTGAPPGAPVPLVDLTGEADPREAAREWMRVRVHSPLAPSAGEVARTAVLRLSPQRHLWFWQLHHIVSDGVGSLLLVRRAAEVHDALAAGRAPAATPFGPLAALVEEDGRYRASAGFQEDRRYWRGVFDGLDRVPGFSDEPLPPTGVARGGGGHHALAVLARGEENLQAPSPAPHSGEGHGRRLPPRQVVVDLLPDERGYRDVPVLTLRPVLERHEGRAAVIAASLGADLPADPDETRASAPSGEGQGLAGALSGTRLQADREPVRRGDVLRDQIDLAQRGILVLVHPTRGRPGYPERRARDCPGCVCRRRPPPSWRPPSPSGH